MKGCGNMSVKVHLPIGYHARADFSCVPEKYLKNYDFKMELLLKQAVSKTGAIIVEIVVSVFPNGGYTAVIVLSESHFSIHTYPEYQLAFADCFTCGDECKPEKALEFLKEIFGAKGEIKIEKREVQI